MRLSAQRSSIRLWNSILSKLDMKLAVIAPRNIVLQPVSLEYVAERLSDHAAGNGLGRLPDVHGTEYLDFRELATQWLGVRRRKDNRAESAYARPACSPPLHACRKSTATRVASAGRRGWRTHAISNNPYLRRRS